MQNFFFGSSLLDTKDKIKIFNSSPKAVFLVKSENRVFALCFGYGYTMFNPGVYEERFGLKVALNSINSENLRSIDKKSMALTPKISKEQITKEGTFGDFGVDIEQDLIQGITGKSIYDDFGQTVSGKDSLIVTVNINYLSIQEFLSECYKRYTRDDYKKDFGWIDYSFEIKDSEIVQKLDESLVEKIKNEDFDKTWMSIPEVIEWERVSEFKLGKKKSFGDDIHLQKYVFFLSETQREISLKTLKTHSIDAIDSSSEKALYSWGVYKCLYCEVRKEEQTFILSNGKWYEINVDFDRDISDFFLSFIRQNLDIDLPDCNSAEHEGHYNERVSQEMGDYICNMDRKLISCGGVNQKVEFCDLFSTNKHLIHVKHYGSSSVLSHLFAQGLISAELFLNYEVFRERLNEKLPEDFKFDHPENKPDVSQYKIVFAIISKSQKSLDIPFFSKVNLKNIVKELEGFGYKVFIKKIATN